MLAENIQLYPNAKRMNCFMINNSIKEFVMSSRNSKELSTAKGVRRGQKCGSCFVVFSELIRAHICTVDNTHVLGPTDLFFLTINSVFQATFIDSSVCVKSVVPVQCSALTQFGAIWPRIGNGSRFQPLQNSLHWIQYLKHTVKQCVVPSVGNSSTDIPL